MTYEGTLLNTFVNNNKNNFPLKVVVTTLQEATTVLNNHSITNDTQLVLHGWTKHIKVLAITAGNYLNTPTNDPMTTFNYYAIPLTYQGHFKVKSKFYRGLSNLVSSGWCGWTKVVSTDLTESPNLRVGDVVRVVDENAGDKMKRDYDGSGSIAMSKRNNDATVAKMHIAGSCSAVFKELIEESDDDLEKNINDNLNVNDEYTMKQLSKLLNFCDLEVRISKASPDMNKPIPSTSSSSSSSLSSLQSTSSNDLPLDQNILLLNPIQEQSVLVSIEHPDAPAFRIPLRTLIYVKLKQTLDKTSSPLQQKSSSASSSFSASQSKKPVLSMFDRCVEMLIKDVFISLLPPQRAFERFAHWYFISNSNDTLLKKNDTSALHQIKKRVAPLPPTTTAQSSQQPSEQSQSLPQLQQQTSQELQQSLLQLLQLQQQPKVKPQIPDQQLQLEQLLQQLQLQLQQNVTPQQPTQLLPNDKLMSQDQLDPQNSNVPNKTNTTITDSQQVETQLEQIRLLQDQHKRLSNELQQQQLLLIRTQQQLQQQLQQTKLLQPQLGTPQDVTDNKQTSSSSCRIETEDDDSIGTATSLQSKECEPHFEIPENGNLYKLNSQQFFEVLRYIKLNQSTLEKCSKQKLNGKKFASLSHDDMLHMGLLHPVVMHFKMSTFKCK